MFRLPRARRVLVLAPHPDDEAIGCGGLLIRLADAGASITVIYVTDGGRTAKGTLDEALASRRIEESTRAAGLLGIQRRIRWGLRDGALDADNLPADELARWVDELDADLILVPHAGEAHADHAAVARLPARLNPDAARTVMTYEVWTPLAGQCLANVTGCMERKLAAIRAYASQCERFNLLSLASGLARYRAAWSRMRSWQFAECFGKCSLAEYGRWAHAD